MLCVVVVIVDGVGVVFGIVVVSHVVFGHVVLGIGIGVSLLVWLVVVVLRVAYLWWVCIFVALSVFVSLSMLALLDVFCRLCFCCVSLTLLHPYGTHCVKMIIYCGFDGVGVVIVFGVIVVVVVGVWRC